MERLPSKIHRIQKELPAWIQKTGKTEQATALMKILDEHLKAQDFQEAEKTADAILKLMGAMHRPPAGAGPEPRSRGPCGSMHSTTEDSEAHGQARSA